MSQKLMQKVIKTVEKVAEYFEFSGEVTEENVKEILESLAVNHTDILAYEIENVYKKAVNQYDCSKYTDMIYRELTDSMDLLLSLLDIKTDYPGLYPSFTLERNGHVLPCNHVLGALREYNNYWNHW